MNVTPLTGAASAVPPLEVAGSGALLHPAASQPLDKTKLAEASQQFEGVLLRQFLSESLKSLVNNGSSGQVYGYFLNDSIANSITKGGGLGLASVFQAQLAGQKGAK